MYGEILGRRLSKHHLISHHLKSISMKGPSHIFLVYAVYYFTGNSICWNWKTNTKCYKTVEEINFLDVANEQASGLMLLVRVCSVSEL